MSSRMMQLAVVSTVSTLFTGAALAGYPYSDRYEAWIQEHAFPLGAWYTGEGSLSQSQRVLQYQNAGYTHMTTDWTIPGRSDAAYAHNNNGMDFTAIITNPTYFEDWVEDAMEIGSGAAAIQVFDEPNNSDIDEVADRIHWVQQNYQVNYSVTPLVFANLSALSIDIDDYITEADPDVLSYDRYPHYLDGTDADYYFSEMKLVRSKSLQYNIPMWMYQQAYQRTDEGQGQTYRLPSESDMRFQAFSFLAHGGQGINHFIYQTENEYLSPGVIDHDTGQPTSVYYAIQDMAPEIMNLAQTLPLIEPVGNVEFLGDAASYFEDVDLFQSTSSRKLYNIEGAESALVSYFEDENGGEYFMIVNLVHGAGVDKDEGEDTMLLFFDPSVTSVKRLNRFTGNIETLNTTNNPSGGNRYLFLTLEGGTGDLFMYPSSNSFVTIPEPAAAGLLLLGSVVVSQWRRGRGFFLTR